MLVERNVESTRARCHSRYELMSRGSLFKVYGFLKDHIEPDSESSGGDDEGMGEVGTMFAFVRV